MKFDSKSMREGPILKSVIVYTVPIILTGLLQLLFNAADLIVVGWFSGSDSVAAVGATGALTNLIINLFIGLSVGAGVAVAQGLGAGNGNQTSEEVDVYKRQMKHSLQRNLTRAALTPRAAKSRK